MEISSSEAQVLKDVLQRINYFDSKPKTKEDYIIEGAIQELNKARKKFPKWPTNMFQAYTIFAEEAGEFAQAVNDYHTAYENKRSNYCKAEYLTKFTIAKDNLQEEAYQTIAMAIRFLEHLGACHYE